MTLDGKQLRILLAIAAAVAGLAATVQTARQARRLILQVVQKSAILGELRRMEMDVSEDRRLLQTFAELRGQPTVDPAELLRQTGLEGRVEWREKERRPLTAGWVLRRLELSGADIPFGAWADLLNRIEQLRPLAHLAEVSLQAAEGTPGAGRAAAAVEIIEAPAS